MLVQCMNQDEAPRAVDVDKESRTYGWVFYKHADGQWVTQRKATEEELTKAEHQAMFLSMLPEKVEPMQERYTKEPWRNDSFAIYDADNRMILQIGISADRCFKTSEMEANARRIVACVNSCKGLRTEFIEKHLVNHGFPLLATNDQLTQQRDELLAALTELLHRAENFHACDVKFSDFEVAKVAMDSARSAIAKVKP